MRETYPLSTETLKVLTDRVGDISEEMDVTTAYLYQILNSDTCDPFAKFRRLFAAAARAGAPVEIWLAELHGIVAKYKRDRTMTEALTDKIATDAITTSELLTALHDGQIDAHEAPRLRIHIGKEREVLNEIEALLPCETNGHNPSRCHGKASVAARKMGKQ